MPKTARIYVTVCEVRTGPLACLSLFAVKSADKVIYFVSEFLNFLVVFRQYISKAHLSTRTPLLIVNIAIILHAIAIMLISMMVPTFIIFASFLYKKGAQHPKTVQNMHLVCLIFNTQCCLDFFMWEGLGSPATSWLGCTARYFSLLFATDPALVA